MGGIRVAASFERTQRATLSVRGWQGESLVGKHIYVQAEQGFGDTLQFVRYIPWLAKRAGKVSLRVHQELLSLMRESFPRHRCLW